MNNNNNKYFSTLALSIFGVIVTFSSAQAAIFKCVNSQEEVYYNDKPCPVNDKETELKAVKDPTNVYIPTYQKENSEELEPDGPTRIGRKLIKNIGKDNKEREEEKTLDSGADETKDKDDKSTTTSTSSSSNSTQASTGKEEREQDMSEKEMNELGEDESTMH